MDKLYLCFWGGDIPFSEKTEENNIKKKIISEAKGIVTIIESDQGKIDELYNPRGKKYCIQYCTESQMQDMKNIYFHTKEQVVIKK